MSNFTNSNETEYKMESDDLLVDDIVKLFFYSFLIIFTVFGNSFVLFVLYRKRKQFNFWRVNLFIFYLALGDMLVALTSMPTNLIYASTNGAWLFGNSSCKAMAFIQVVAPSSTSFLIVSMALDRYRAVINASRSNKQIYLMIGGSWFFALLLALPQVHGWGTYPSEDGSEEYCGAKAEWLASPAFKAYMVLVFILILIIPTFTNCFCYGKIIKRLFYDPKTEPNTTDGTELVENRRETMTTNNPTEKTPAKITPSSHPQFTVTERIRAARIRTTKLALLIVVFYTVCWLPYFVVLFIMIFSPYNISNRTLDVVEGLAMVNSCINPLVYGKYTFKQSDVEQAFKCFKPEMARNIIKYLGIAGNSNSESRNQTYDQHFALKLQIYRQQRQNLQNGYHKATST
ncbi:cardioacceleratory peptide receptor-like [Symsagittifera roscoffensis]|uniref:cardioacceleratory peptide receptor-like n=1 Tax=Symsagittifera roscoffensis TaxID=84072 RepID=UPI00307CC3DB